MAKISKNIKYLLFCILTFAILFMLAFVWGAVNADAAELGSESPYVYCRYTDDSGAEYDGNTLAAGTYNVEFILQGVSDMSVAQVTATYNASVTDVTVKSLISDSHTDISSMGTITENNNIVFGFVSDNDTASQIDADGQVLAAFVVTFADSCDAADAITVSTDPNKTFILADYTDGYDDEYALVTQSDSYSGSLYLMTCDISPASDTDKITISGTVYIAQSIDGSQYSNKGIDGIDILVNGEVVGTSGTGGAFSVTVPTGTTELTFHRDNTTIDRTVKLGGTNVTDAVVSVITCDYTGDKKVNGLDIVTFASALSGADNKYCDLNTDGKVNGLDTVIFSAFLGKTADYVDITLG